MKRITMIVFGLILGLFSLLAGCQTTGSTTDDPSFDPYNVDGIEIEKG